MKKMNEPWKTDEFWVSPYNYEDSVTSSYKLTKKVKIHDTTLRDGEQTPGVVFQMEEKVFLAKLLDEIGVDRIEVAMPLVSEDDKEATKKITNLNLNADIYTLCRAVESDIDLSLQCGVDGVIIEVPVGVPKLKYMYPDWTEEKIINIAVKSINYAKSRGLKVTFFLMDVTRSEKRFFQKLVESVSNESPPNGLAIVDTAGCLLPKAAANMVRYVKQWTDIPIEVHTHNDMGLGLANTLAALEAGAEVAHVCVNGLGPRGGNASLEEVVMTLHCLYGYETNINYSRLSELSKVVVEKSGFPIHTKKPFFGDGLFCRESGLGIKLVKTAPLAMFSLNPKVVGQESKIVLGKKSGKESIKYKISELGMDDLSDEQINAVLLEVKTRSITKKGLIDDNEFKQIVDTIKAK